MNLYVFFIISSYAGFYWGSQSTQALIVVAIGYLLMSITVIFIRPKPLWIWWSWSLQGLFLIAFYMMSFGMANIVGSAQKFSARMAVSTLRTLLWAQDQCIAKTQRSCSLVELNGQKPPQGIHTSLLRYEFRKTVVNEANLSIIHVGQYLYVIYPMHDLWGQQGWIAYAWPFNDPTLQSFCMTHYEEILELIPRGHYQGLSKRPLAQACLGSLHQDPNPPLSEASKKAIARGEKPLAPTHQATDQQIWKRWRGKRTRRAKAMFP